jgi:protein-S-isoprenylcysteine O-methyltransferase
MAATSTVDHFGDARGLGVTAACGALLGAVFGAHALWLCAFATRAWEVRWCLYALSMSAFHFGEFALTAVHQPRDATAHSFLLDHSVAYGVAAVASWFEFWAELALAPALKERGASLLAGAALVVAGQALRSAAMATAGRSFTHLVATRRRAGHELVTRGVYAVLRHPSYLGWFAWSVGTQVLLANPVCAAAYAAAAWRFFAARAPFEEEALVDFFGAEYVRYARRTLGLPCVRSPARECAEGAADARAAASAAAAAEDDARAARARARAAGGAGARAWSNVWGKTVPLERARGTRAVHAAGAEVVPALSHQPPH